MKKSSSMKKTNKVVSLVLVFAMLMSIFACSAITTSAETTTVNGVSVNVGDTIVYKLSIQNDQVIECFHADTTYSSGLQPVYNSATSTKEFFPDEVRKAGLLIVNAGYTSACRFEGTSTTGYDFRTESLLATFKFKVLESGDHEVKTNFTVMTSLKEGATEGDDILSILSIKEEVSVEEETEPSSSSESTQGTSATATSAVQTTGTEASESSPATATSVNGVSVKVGDTVTYTLKIQHNKFIECMQGITTYSSGLSQIYTDPEDTDEFFVSDFEGFLTANAEANGGFKFSAMNLDGYDFTTGAVILNLKFKVNEEGSHFIKTDFTALDELTTAESVIDEATLTETVALYQEEASSETDPSSSSSVPVYGTKTVTVNPNGAFATADGVYLYAYSDTEGSNAEWPGVEMTKAGDNYTAEVSEKYGNVIIAAKYGTVTLQTPTYALSENISVETQRVYFPTEVKGYTSVTMHMWNNSGNATTWPGIDVSSLVESGSIVIPTLYTNTIFVGDGANIGEYEISSLLTAPSSETSSETEVSSSVEESSSSEVASSSSEEESSSQEESSSESVPVYETKTVTVNPNGAFATADGVYLYAYSDTEGSNAEWPGVEMTKAGDNYTAEVSEKYGNVIIAAKYGTVTLQTPTYALSENISVETQRVYFPTEVKGYTSVTMHMWNNSGNATTWPGIDVSSLVESGSIVIPTLYTNTIFVGDGTQLGQYEISSLLTAPSSEASSEVESSSSEQESSSSVVESSSSETTPTPITYVTKIALSKTSSSIFKGKESTVKVTSFSPKSATNQTIKWSLS
ncbi:MAG: hypothetical protein ACI4QE_03270, partial [Acutalibacteraceae bacterium]